MAVLFTKTSSIAEAVALIQSISANKLPLILKRLVEKLHEPEEAAFTEEEISKLTNSLKISKNDVQLLLTTCTFFFSQAAFHNAKPGIFGRQLAAVGMDEDRVSIFQEIWTEQGKSVVSLLRKQSIATHQKHETTQIEFDHKELYQFFDQLDTIQSQLDSLS
ncbi:COMM domain-containing protein 10-like isoform X2 [Watersipora subatra]|uniref:COMM domain-containing protein 10-like isoform X2 n=1 Tax=Watersipora subatra TaxID=2589382 RepID=UPI00355C422F